jgi:glycine cleavage system T protein (aminomethyltransferase)
MHARRRGRAKGAAPKEQPPRKLSGKRTAGGRALWKAAAGNKLRPLTEGVSPGGGSPAAEVNLSGSTTEGARFGRCGARSVGGVRVTLAETAPLKRTPLYPLHCELGAKMVPFAGYDMPVQYSSGILAEHLHTRSQAGLFDVSHMGQIRLAEAGAIAALEALVPGDLQALAPMRMRYTLLLNEVGGILDDLMVTRLADGLFVVVNAARKEADLAHLRDRLGTSASIEPLADRALLALQGPAAAAVLSRFVEGIAGLRFMSAAAVAIDGRNCLVTRSGYTGEDGFELSLAASEAEALARRLIGEPEVLPIGLGARDSLRLEAGLCLYGHDIDETTTPIEADLAWTIGKRRRADGGFPGAATVLRQLAEGTRRKRVGIRPDGRAPAREGTEIVDEARNKLGHVTSGGFGPSVGAPVAMGYVNSTDAVEGTSLLLLVREAPRPARVVRLPFVPPRYYRG